MSGRVIAMRYIAFAVIATLLNLAAQRWVMASDFGGWTFALALIVGTLVGLVVKYILDKRWIFYDLTAGPRAQGRQFGLYSLMGVATTLIFWLTETLFWKLWGTEFAREFGAVLGLTVGYYVKYQLDRRFVFQRAMS